MRPRSCRQVTSSGVYVDVHITALCGLRIMPRWAAARAVVALDSGWESA